ncbi:MAG: antitoxin Xre/MbcA/ParS toxin-binding domain-containing protein [Verrucomicrobium sp.]
MKREIEGKEYATEPSKAGLVVSDFVANYRVKTRFPGNMTSGELISAIEKGLPFQELVALQESFGVSLERLAGILGMAKATLNRRRVQGRLIPEESDRIVRFARLMSKAVEVLESEDQARLWLTCPQTGLGGAIPLEYARTEVGAREVDDLLSRIEYGVYA